MEETTDIQVLGVLPHCGVVGNHPAHIWQPDMDVPTTFECGGTVWNPPSGLGEDIAVDERTATNRWIDLMHVMQRQSEVVERLNGTLNRLIPYLDRMEATMNRPAVNWLLGGKRNG